MKESKMKTIGEIANIVQVSVSTLRYYDEIDLLKPVHIDEQSKYRYYTDEQVSQLLRILELKSYGFNLDAIRNLLEENSDQVLLNAYHAKLTELNSSINALNDTKDKLTQRIMSKDKESLLRKRILLVDDSEFIRNIVANILNKHDYIVEEHAANGVEAIDKFIDLKPQLVIMDIGMPKLDGINATEEILKHDKDAIVIMCSAHNEFESILLSLKVGATHFIPKPFSEHQLLKTIEESFIKRHLFNPKFLDQILTDDDCSPYLKSKLSYEDVNMLIEILKSYKKSELIDFLMQIK